MSDPTACGAKPEPPSPACGDQRRARGDPSDQGETPERSNTSILDALDMPGVGEIDLEIEVPPCYLNPPDLT